MPELSSAGEALKRAGADVNSYYDTEGERVEIIALGSGQEVGRSCVILMYRGKTIMFDCGIHPGIPGIGTLPYFDTLLEREELVVDLLLVTHFHMDHS